MTWQIFLAVFGAMFIFALLVERGLDRISESLKRRRRARQFNEQLNWRNR